MANFSVNETKIITVANQKGGVGKTTTVMNMGVALAKAGKRVLLVDGDPQANLTSYLGVTPGQAPYDAIRTLDEVYLSKRAWDQNSKQLFFTKTQSGVDLIASDKNLAGVEYYLFTRQDREAVLAQFFASAHAQYDYILLDTPPSLNLLTINSLCASDYVLIPVQPEFFSLEGIVKIREAISDIRARWNPKLKILGVLPTQVSHRRKLTHEVIDTLKSELSDVLFDAMIHDSSAVAESSGHARSVLEYNRSSRGSKDYQAAALELIKRVSMDTDLAPIVTEHSQPPSLEIQS